MTKLKDKGLKIETWVFKRKGSVSEKEQKKITDSLNALIEDLGYEWRTYSWLRDGYTPDDCSHDSKRVRLGTYPVAKPLCNPSPLKEKK